MCIHITSLTSRFIFSHTVCETNGIQRTKFRNQQIIVSDVNEVKSKIDVMVLFLKVAPKNVRAMAHWNYKSYHSVFYFSFTKMKILLLQWNYSASSQSIVRSVVICFVQLQSENWNNIIPYLQI